MANGKMPDSTTSTPMLAPTNKMKRRMFLVVLTLLVLAAGYICTVIYNTTVVRSEYYRSKANSQQLSSYTITANRGTIYDRSGKILAQSTTVWDVVLSPKAIAEMDEKLIEDAITEKTKAIVPVHYAGVACEMDAINEIAKRHNLFVVEDAAQGMMATYKGRALGSLGDFGCYSYHETKNYSMGEGGALLINDPKYNDRAEIIREKGTNRCQFHRGEVDKYTWVELGSSYLPSELNAAYLYAELECADIINDARMACWNEYRKRLAPLAEKGLVELPYIPEHCKHNAHMFYLKVEDLATRTALLKHLVYNGILAVFHYVPLHSSPAGMRFGRFHGEDKYTTNESNRLLRLPMFYGLKTEEIEYICGKVYEFFGA